MKRLSFFIIAFVLVKHTSAQEISPKPATIEVDYLQKSKNQKGGGVLLLVAGSLGLAVTFLSDVSQASTGLLTTVCTLGTEVPEYKSYTVPYLLSGAGMAGGIILLSASANNKRKASLAHLFLDVEKAQRINSRRIIDQSIPVAGIRLKF